MLLTCSILLAFAFQLANLDCKYKINEQPNFIFNIFLEITFVTFQLANQLLTVCKISTYLGICCLRSEELGQSIITDLNHDGSSLVKFRLCFTVVYRNKTKFVWYNLKIKHRQLLVLNC